MKILCKKENLLEAINTVQKAVSVKSTLQILQGILITAKNDIKLTGNDLEVGIESTMDGKILEEGSIVLNSRLFGEIVRKMPQGDIEINIDESLKAIIRCENSVFEIKGISPGGYPAIPEVEKENTIILKKNKIKEMIRQTVFCTSMDENRPIFTGELLDCKNNEVILVAIDGYRMAYRKSSTDIENNEFKAVIPGKTLNEISRIMQGEDEDVEIIKSNNLIMFSFQNCKIVSRILEGEFLKYEEVIPDEFETKIIIEKDKFLSSIERTMLLVSEEIKSPVKITISEEKINILMTTEIGSINDNLNIDVNGKEIEIGFNSRYLADALKNIDDEVIEINFNSDVGPCIIKPIDSEEFIYMILPVRIKNE